MSQKSVNAIKVLGVDAINKAKSGHPGVVMGAAPMAYSLFTKHLRVNPKKTDWINRDRFVLSAGHGSMLLYSLLQTSVNGVLKLLGTQSLGTLKVLMQQQVH